jgi:hypothetical protein
MTITIPVSVKEQMDQIKENVNWSGVAAEAFQRKVVEIRTRRSKAMTKHKVIERLKSAGEADPMGFEAGHALGRQWAEEKALPRYLRNLAKDPEAGFAQQYDEEDGTPIFRRLCVRLANVMTGECNADFEALWTEALGPNGDSLADKEDFARGFGAGALEVWEEVKDAL